jgi:hypothetical protein
MANSVVKQAHMNLIVNRIQEGRCVPFLGAAANVSNETRGYAGLPLGANVANELINSTGIDFVGSNPNDLARVALQCELDTDRPELIRTLKMILPDGQCAPSPLLRTLAQLPLKLIVTTNYDRLMECALENTGIDPEVIVQPTKGFESTPDTMKRFAELVDYRGLILYKIHGTFRGKAPPVPDQPDEEHSTVIVTEDDYIEFLTLVDKQEERIGVPRLISSKIAYSTLLFLGYSLEDWDFRTIYKGLIEKLPKNQRRKSFAIQKDPSEFWVRFWQKKGVEIYDMDLYEFAEQLETQYQERYG